jgi:hypothetical protein
LDSNDAVLGTLNRLEPEREADYDSTGNLAGFYYRGNQVVLVPSSSSTATTLRMSYFIRPNELAAISATNGIHAISAINTSTKAVTVAGNTAISTSTPCDLVAATPGFESLDIDLTPTAASGTVITFGNASALPTDLAVGDYVCLAGKSPVPQIPAEFHPILAQRVACAWMEAFDAPGLEKAVAKLGKMEEAAGVLVSPRSPGNPRKLVNLKSSALGSGGTWRRIRRA